MGSALRIVVTLGLFAVASGIVACGHPASDAECRTILYKSAELKLKEQNVHPDLIERRIEEMMDAKGDELLAQCRGRRITKAMLDCVKSADTEAAVDRCLTH